jgi:bifunctional UDP-N-acetylglucosamine pyrophosphorylase / glucosamine-1-phosphate N-acetyltransferase
MKKINAFILAAGKGTRLNKGSPSTIPKVLYEIQGRSMINYTLDLLKKINIKKPVIIVGYKANLVKIALGNKNIIYVLQKKQLGTGHALLCAKNYLKNAKTALVMGGDDSAFYKPETILELIRVQRESGSVITLLTIEYPNPQGLGRIIRNGDGKIIAIIEEKEASPDQKKIKEVNAGCYCFKAAWLLENLPRIKLHQQAQEYYITNLVKIAIAENQHVTSLKITNHKEWMGVNTSEQLDKANRLMGKLTKNNV